MQLRVLVGENPEVACRAPPRKRISGRYSWGNYSSLPTAGNGWYSTLSPLTWIWMQGLSIFVMMSSTQWPGIILLDVAQWRPKQLSPLQWFYSIILREEQRQRRKDAIVVTVAGHGMAECPGQAMYKMLTSVARPYHQQQCCNFPHWKRWSALLVFRPKSCWPCQGFCYLLGEES